MAVVQIQTLPDYSGHAPRELFVKLTPQQAVKLCQIRCGLIDEGAKLAGSGHVIKDNSEALRYLIEQATAV